MDDAGPTRPDETAPEGRYELRGKLGSGGTGVVYRAFDRVRGREVALKSLRNTEGRDLFRFKREFRSLADLAHPNLIALYELSTAGSDWMFTMELVDGTSLKALAPRHGDAAWAPPSSMGTRMP